jgi:pimeloyl-ACP methyl ester carboxylesterase
MEKSFTYQNTKVYYKLQGSGKPVLLLHGFGEDSKIWNEQVAYLQGHCTLIIPDLPGSAKSQLLNNSSVTIDDYADCIYELLQYESIQRLSIFGHSMGGYITLSLVEKHPEIVVTYGLIHSTAFADTEEKKSTRKKGIEVIKQYGAPAFLKSTIPNLFSGKFKKQHPEEVADLIDAGNQFSAEALIQYYTAMMNRPDRTEVLRTNSIPVLFIIGTEDVAAPLADLEQQIKLPAVAEVHIMDDVGHMSMMEACDDLNTYMLEFVSKY